MHSPVEQFAIKVLFALNLFGFDIQFTNSALFMVLAVLVSSAFFVFRYGPGRYRAWQNAGSGRNAL